VDAFAIHASGYVFKPVTKEAVLYEIENFRYPMLYDSGIKIQKIPPPGREKLPQVKTFGNFDIFVNGLPVIFNRLKAKEAFAYLIDRKGSSVTTAELASILWEEREYTRSLQNQVQVIISSMMKTLRDNGISDVIIKTRNQIAVDASKIKCDYYDYLSWDVAAVNAYEGEYMTSYSWAEMTAGTLAMKSRQK